MRPRWGRALVTLVLVAPLVFAGCTVTAPAGGGPVANGAGADGGFRPGDRVEISVTDQPELSGTHVLDADGMIDLPLLGAVDAYGATADGLATRLVALYADGYLRQPFVAVAATAPRPYFVSGEVDRPGSYPFVPGTTLAAALARAGADPVAAVRVVRNGTEIRIDPAAPLAPGDIIELVRSAG